VIYDVQLAAASKLKKDRRHKAKEEVGGQR